MTTISAKSDVMTLINMFTVEPANQRRLVELLTEATEVSVGPKRAKEWPRIAKILEDKEGLPRVDVLMGERFWPAVVAYFRIRHGMEVQGVNQG
jgi:hypothetical protein